MKRNYFGHESQIYGVEEHRLVGGKGDGMRLFQVKNGQGLEFTVSADRCADISRLSFKGDNYGFFSVNGYVAPTYYDDKQAGFLKSFTAGFLTTCGLTAVGSPCIDEGEALPLHGTIGNTPAERIYWDMDEHDITIHAVINQSGIFADKLIMNRTITCSKERNHIKITDRVKNIGSSKSPIMLLYHINMGYPLLDEDSQLHIPSKEVLPRNEHAKDGIKEWNIVYPPQADFEEQCYYHSFDKDGLAAIYNPNMKKGLAIHFDIESFDCFTQWKMFGEKDYVLGLEPGNCNPDGRDRLKKEGKLKYILPNEEKEYSVEFDIIDGIEQWNPVIRGHK